LIEGKETDAAIINNFTAHALSSSGFENLVKTTFKAVAPKDLEGITLVN